MKQIIFWNETKKIFVNSVPEAKEKGNLSISQRQAIINPLVPGVH